MNQQPSTSLEQTHAFQANSAAALSGNRGQRQAARRLLWIDGVGGYLLLDRDDNLIGQAVASSLVDIGIEGDLSRQAGVLRRRQADYLLEPLQETRIDGRLISGLELLAAEAQIQFGPRVKLRLIKPHPLSSTARLELLSLHRFQPRLDGVLLLGDSCILGPGPSCHVRCTEWERDLLMFRQDGQWYFRAIEEIEANGQPTRGQIPLVAGLRLRGPDFSLSIE